MDTLRKLRIGASSTALIILTLMTTLGCGAKSLQGSWVRIDDEAPQGQTIKILTEERFAFGLHAKNEIVAGGGRYVLDDETYTETIQYHWMPNLVGKTVVFDCAIDGDIWHHTGRIKTGGGVLVIDEVWERIE
ncbi:MAG: hypothetical protein HKN20_13810 [Gemmatimonadetes bacterium]|nr:hypothetical protein [Gemmatimonadota bacterium]